MGIFAWCAIIGCTLLVAGILFDGLLDALLPDGLVPILALPVAVFGAIGMGVTATTDSAAAQVPAAVLWGVPTAAALGSGALMRWLWNRLRRSMPLDTAPPTAAELVGEKVTVLWWRFVPSRAATSSPCRRDPSSRCARGRAPGCSTPSIPPWPSSPGSRSAAEPTGSR